MPGHLQPEEERVLPSPIAHSLAGLVVSRAQCNNAQQVARPTVVALVAVAAANLPDADFLPGLLTGDANRFHHAFTHSFGFLMAVTLATFLLARAFRSAPAFWTGLVGFGVASHLLLDFFTVDTRPPFGIPLLWPFSNRAFLAPHPLFLDIQRSGNPAEFFQSLFSAHNFAAAGREFFLVGGALLLVDFLCRTAAKVDKS